MVFTCRHGGLPTTTASSNSARPQTSFSIRPHFSANGLMASTHTPRQVLKDRRPRQWRGNVWEQQIRHGCYVLTSLSVANAVRERSMCHNFAVCGLRAQHFANSALVRAEKLSKHISLTIWHAVSDYGVSGHPIHLIQWWQGGDSSWLYFKQNYLLSGYVITRFYCTVKCTVCWSILSIVLSWPVRLGVLWNLVQQCQCTYHTMHLLHLNHLTSLKHICKVPSHSVWATTREHFATRFRFVAHTECDSTRLLCSVRPKAEHWQSLLLQNEFPLLLWSPVCICPGYGG